MPIDGIRIIGRGTQGVTVFDTAKDKKVVSVEHLAEEETNGEEGNGDVPIEDEG
jgi:DNA gyrase subunit A